jgi:D-alanyl-D-alanine carboxypeptidase
MAFEFPIPEFMGFDRLERSDTVGARAILTRSAELHPTSTAPLRALAEGLAALGDSAGTAAARARLAELPRYRKERVDAMVAEWRATRSVPGASVVVVREGSIEFAEGYGLADVEHQVPVTSRTLFQSGSLAKAFIAATVLTLVADRRLELDAPLSSYFEEVPAAWERITARHLLNNTAGLGDYLREVDLRHDFDDGRLLDLLKQTEPGSQPGEQWAYSNSGYALLGLLIGEITGSHWFEALREGVLLPQSMVDTRLISESEIVPGRAAGYELRDGELRKQHWVAPYWNTTADGALYLNAADLGRWLIAMERGLDLQPDLARSAFTPARLADGSRFPHGFGWFLGEVDGRPTVGHGGSWQGFASYILRLPSESLAIAVLSNSRSAQPELLAFEIASAYVDDFHPLHPPPITVGRATLRQFAGRYEIGRDTIEIEENGGRLQLTWADGDAWDLTATGDLSFARIGHLDRIRFSRGADGRINGFTLAILGMGDMERATRIAP